MARKRTNQESGLRNSISYRFHFKGLVSHLNEIARGNSTLGDMPSEIIRFSIQAGLITDSGAITEKGNLFLKNPKVCVRVFRSVIFQIAQFAQIWNQVEEQASRKGNVITRPEIQEFVKKSLDPKISSSKTSTSSVYTGRVVEWALSAGLLSPIEPRGRIVKYNVHPRSELDAEPELENEQEFIQEILVPHAEQPAVQSPVRTHMGCVDEIDHLVCALSRHPWDPELVKDVKSLSELWKKAQSHSPHEQREKRMILHLLDHALRSGRRDEFEMVAEAIWILRREFRESST